MISKRIKRYIFFIAVFFSLANVTSASVLINEIQLSPTEERFIEIYNSESSSVDLTNWYIQRKTASGSDFGSLVSKTYFEGKSIGAGDYFVISRSDITNADIVHKSLTLTESNTIQLKNSNQEVVNKVGWGDVSDCGGVCAPNPTDGKSIGRKSDGSWIVASRTPGVINSSSLTVDDNQNNDDTEGQTENTENSNNTSSTSSSSDSNKNVPLVLKITTKIISPKTIVAGIPFTLNSLTTTNRGETYLVGRWIWNFGDGMSKEVRVSSLFEYIYDYPGEYVVPLSYFDNNFDKVPDATDRITIRVVPSEIYISGVGTELDPFIEIENKSNYEMTLSNWIVTAGAHYFIIPDGTTLLPNKKLKLSPRITGFVGSDITFVTITDPNKEITATYPSETKKLIPKVFSTQQIVNNDIVPINNDLKDESLLEEKEIVNLNDLGANASNTGVNIPNSIYPFIGLIFIIGVGGASFLIIKKKNVNLDEPEIRAEDIKIIE